MILFRKRGHIHLPGTTNHRVKTVATDVIAADRQEVEVALSDESKSDASEITSERLVDDHEL